MTAILIIIILSCVAIFVSMFVQAMIQELNGNEPFCFRFYDWPRWFMQITWWILQLCLFIWGMIELYPNLIDK